MKTKARAWLAARAGEHQAICVVFGCSRPTMLAAGIGLAPMHCRQHVDFHARHGSFWHRSYGAKELKPYLAAARAYIRPRLQTDQHIMDAVMKLALMLEESPHEIATRLRGMKAKARARIAFGRLRRKGVKPERLLAVYLAITVLIREEPSGPRSKEFRLVQVAKALHRLASGHHVMHEMWVGDRRYKNELHKYPRSIGSVLRHMGEAVEERCEWATAEHADGVLALKVKRYGRHPALPPGSSVENSLRGTCDRSSAGKSCC